MTDLSGPGLLLAAAGGLAGSLHCLGMCGAFPLALSSASRPGARALRQVLYQLGRLNALAFLGAVAGAVGATFVLEGSLGIGALVLACIAGATMVALGLEMLGGSPVVTRVLASTVGRVVTRPMRALLGAPSPLAPLALGALNAFLPCHLVYAVVAQAAASARPVDGMLTMLAFGAGTVPAMLGLGLVGGQIPPRLRLLFDRGVAVALVVYGGLLIVRGVIPEGHHAHGSSNPLQVEQQGEHRGHHELHGTEHSGRDHEVR